MEPAIACEDLGKTYRSWFGRETVALDGLDLEVEPGRIVGLLGPNGSGKTTTIRILLGLIRPSRGRASVLGRWPGHPESRAGLGYLPEKQAIHPRLGGRETLDVYGRIHGIGRGERSERVEELLERVGLDPASWDRPVRTYSKGMARRLGLAQALVMEPELLVLDEPTAGLDPLGTRHVQELLCTMRDEGRSILLSSHLLGQVEGICDHVVVLHRGRRVASGPVDDLLVHRDEVEMRFRGLGEEGRSAVRRVAEDHGGEVTGETAPREELEAFFARTVGGAEAGEPSCAGDDGGSSGDGDGEDPSGDGG